MELVHGGDLYSASQTYRGKILDFSANINPLGMPMSVQQVAVSALTDCVHYPDPLCRVLREAISHTEQVPTEWIICGNGAADLIFRLAFALCPKQALVLSPCFAEYEQALSAVGCHTEHHLLSAEKNFCLEKSFLDVLTPTLDVLFLCNPNNPTGQLVSGDLLKCILQKCEEYGTFLVIDECFLDFLEEKENLTLKPQLTEHSNLFLLKAFTKIYAMPGLRLGYGLCSNLKLLNKLAGCGQPWSVSGPAQAAGTAALSETEFVRETQCIIAQEREYLSRELSRLELRVYPSYANYILFQVKNRLPLKERLLQEGILIRSCENYYGLDERFYRIAVRSHIENKELVTKMQKVLKEG